MESNAAIRALAALAHKNRLAAFRLLVRAGPEGVAAGEIAEKLAIGANALSFHLKELERAGLISARRDGRYIRYALACDGMRILLDYLVHDCCRGREDICAPLQRETVCCE